MARVRGLGQRAHVVGVAIGWRSRDLPSCGAADSRRMPAQAAADAVEDGDADAERSEIDAGD